MLSPDENTDPEETEDHHQDAGGTEEKTTWKFSKGRSRQN